MTFLSLAKINRLPSAPGSIAIGTTLSELSAEAAAAVANGAASVTQYEVQRQPAGGAFVAMAVSGRRGAVAAPGLFGSGQTFRARARSEAGWGPWSAEFPFAVPALLGRRTDAAGAEVVCQSAERYVGGGVWVPVSMVERFTGSGWVQPA